MLGAIHKYGGRPDITDLFINVEVVHKHGGRPGITDLFMNMGDY
jgi:hypothetical protein